MLLFELTKYMDCAAVPPTPESQHQTNQHSDAPRDRVQSVFHGEKPKDVRREVSARIMSIKLFPGLVSFLSLSLYIYIVSLVFLRRKINRALFSVAAGRGAFRLL